MCICILVISLHRIKLSYNNEINCKVLRSAFFSAFMHSFTKDNYFITNFTDNLRFEAYAYNLSKPLVNQQTFMWLFFCNTGIMYQSSGNTCRLNTKKELVLFSKYWKYFVTIYEFFYTLLQ